MGKKMMLTNFSSHFAQKQKMALQPLTPQLHHLCPYQCKIAASSPVKASLLFQLMLLIATVLTPGQYSLCFGVLLLF